jgi:hypothetical protein
MSNQWVDGQLHHAPGKMRLDRASCAQTEDWINSKKGLCNFITNFHVVDQLVADVRNLNFNHLSYNYFTAMTFLQPDTPIPRKSMNDFLTTI